MFSFFRRKPRCPIDEVTRNWIESRWKWLTEEFGGEFMIDTPTVLPTDQWFPDPYDRSEDAVRTLVERVSGFMHVPFSLVDLEFYSEDGRPRFVNDNGLEMGGTAGTYEERDRHHIRIEHNQALEPMHLVGTVAHELSHARLLGENRLDPDVYDNELLTDLNVVFHGLGVFLANVPRHWPADATTWPGTSQYKPEYMTTPMFGYALAYRCWLREESPDWLGHLVPGVRAEFKAGMKFLQARIS